MDVHNFISLWHGRWSSLQKKSHFQEAPPASLTKSIHVFPQASPLSNPRNCRSFPIDFFRCMFSQFLLPLSLQRSLTSIMVTLVVGSMEGMLASLAIAPLGTHWYTTTCLTSTLEQIIVIPPSPYSPYFSPSSSLPTPALTLPPLPPPVSPSPTHTGKPHLHHPLHHYAACRFNTN